MSTVFDESLLTLVQQKAKRNAKAYFFSSARAEMAEEGEITFASSGNIVGVGIGAKIESGSNIIAEEAVRIYVHVKIPKNQLASPDVIPEEFNGLPTDVIEVGDVIAYQTLKSWQRFGTNRPTSCGVSVGHPQVTAGTLGCLVEKDGDHFILSNNHVLADSNNATIGDTIIQAGRIDGGASPNSDIAVLSAFKSIDFNGADNDIDAAIAKIGDSNQTLVEPEIIDIGLPKTNTKLPARYLSVRKHGRTTGHTIGFIEDVSADIDIRYGSKIASFVNLIAIKGAGSVPFSQGGDSGSLIVDAVTLNPVGLLFAGDNNFTWANPIDSVLDYFGVNIIGS
jgi:hypothetical protein